MGKECNMHEEMRNACKISVRKPEGKRPFGIPMHKWEDNIKMYFMKTGWEGVVWMHLAQDRVQ
jgi:hypothetical protein